MGYECIVDHIVQIYHYNSVLTMLIERNNPRIMGCGSSDQVVLRNVYRTWKMGGGRVGAGLKLPILLTTGEDEVALMFIQRKLSKLHGLADHCDVTPEAEHYNINTRPV